MKNVLLFSLLILVVSVNAQENKQIFKELKLCDPITKVEKLAIFSSFNFMDPLAFVNTKKPLQIGAVKFNKTFDLRFNYGKLDVINVRSYASNFKNVKSFIEKKYGKKFVFIKSNNQESACDYYLIKDGKKEINLTYGCGSSNYMGMTIFKHCYK